MTVQLLVIQNRIINFETKYLESCSAFSQVFGCSHHLFYYYRTEIDESLVCAVKAGRAEMVKYLLKQKEENAAKKEDKAEKGDGMKALIHLIRLSAKHGQANCTKVLLEAGADPTETKEEEEGGQKTNCLNIAIAESHKYVLFFLCNTYNGERAYGKNILIFKP